MNKVIGIYKITNILDNKIYIGQSVNVKKRWAQHKFELNGKKHQNIHLQRAWNKYGEDNFIFEIIELCNKENINERELFWINELKPQYNFKGGGDSIHTVNEETKKKMSIAKKGKKGKLMPNELKEKLRDMKIGVPRSEEIRKKISLALLGRKLQQKHIDKMKEYYKENSPVNSKKIICLNDKNIFKSIAEASKFYKINSGMIVRVCKKQRNHTHGLVFEYYKEDKND